MDAPQKEWWHGERFGLFLWGSLVAFIITLMALADADWGIFVLWVWFILFALHKRGELG